MWNLTGLASLGRRVRAISSADQRRRRTRARRSLRFESLEGRELLSAVPPAITFDLLDDTGRPDDRLTTHALVGGDIAAHDKPFNVRIEFDIDGDGTPDVFRYPHIGGKFAIDLNDKLAYGEHEISARAVTEGKASKDHFGDWQTTTFRYEPSAFAPTRILDMQVDAGGVLTGTVAQDGARACLQIELDIDNDGTVDAYVFSDGGEFRYDLSDRLAAGTNAVVARTVVQGDNGAEQFIGNARLITFEYTPEELSINQEQMWVASATWAEGESYIGDDDDVSPVPPISELQVDINAMLTGRVLLNDPYDAYYLYIEIDYNMDGWVDEYTYADLDGYFSYDLSWAIPEGARTAGVRVTQYYNPYDPYGDPLIGEWHPIMFNYFKSPILEEFTIEAGQSNVWVFRGFVTYWMPSDTTIQFGGILDGHSVNVLHDGTFEFSLIMDDPSGLVSAQAFDPFDRGSNVWQELIV